MRIQTARNHEAELLGSPSSTGGSPPLADVVDVLVRPLDRAPRIGSRRKVVPAVREFLAIVRQRETVLGLRPAECRLVHERHTVTRQEAVARVARVVVRLSKEATLPDASLEEIGSPFIGLTGSETRELDARRGVAAVRPHHGPVGGEAVVRALASRLHRSTSKSRTPSRLHAITASAGLRPRVSLSSVHTSGKAAAAIRPASSLGSV